jgi:hypothetical protein
VVRGGLSRNVGMKLGETDANGYVQGVSVNTAAGASIKELGSAGVVSKYKTIGVTTTQAIEDAGGRVVPKPLVDNPFHSEIFDVLREKLEQMLQEQRNEGYGGQ